MAGPFRSDEDVRRSRFVELEQELTELDEDIANARRTVRELRRRERPLLWSILSPWSIAFVIAGIGIGACAEIGVDERWIAAKCSAGDP